MQTSMACFIRYDERSGVILRKALGQRLCSRGGAAAHSRGVQVCAQVNRAWVCSAVSIWSARSALLAGRRTPITQEAPVCLDIYAGGRLIGQTLASHYRKDLENAGLGSGHRSFSRSRRQPGFLWPQGQ